MFLITSTTTLKDPTTKTNFVVMLIITTKITQRNTNEEVLEIVHERKGFLQAIDKMDIEQ